MTTVHNGRQREQIAAALAKLRAARSAEVDAVSSLIGAVLDIDMGGSTSPRPTGAAAAAAPSPGPGSDCYLSVRQLAVRVPYAEHTIRNLMAAGVLREGIHYFKRRGRVMFSWSTMRAWVEEGGDAALSSLPLVRGGRGGR